MTSVSNVLAKRTAPNGNCRWGRTRHWRTEGPDIPCQVASPQSLVPFLQAESVYLACGTICKYYWTPKLCLENPFWISSDQSTYALAG